MDRIKLKHIDRITLQPPDLSQVMVDVYDYKKWWLLPNSINRKIMERVAKKAIALVNKVLFIKPDEVEEQETTVVRRPDSIDEISFLAMMEIQAYKSSENKLSLSEDIANMIVLATFGENSGEDFNMEGDEFNRLFKFVLEQPLLEMLGLYNWINKSLDASNLRWEKMFASVKVDDPDYEEAGGGAMEQYNMVQSIKKICKDFNVSDKEAEQISYLKSQISSLADATQAFVQDRLSKIKERKMAARRK